MAFVIEGCIFLNRATVQNLCANSRYISDFLSVTRTHSPTPRDTVFYSNHLKALLTTWIGNRHIFVFPHRRGNQGEVLMLESPWVLVTWLVYFPWFEYHHRRESSQPSVKKQTEVLTFKATVLVVSYCYHFTTEPLSLLSRHPMLTAGSGYLPPLGAAASLQHLAPRSSLLGFLPFSSSPAFPLLLIQTAFYNAC